MAAPSASAEESQWLRVRAAALLAPSPESLPPEYAAVLPQFMSADRADVSIAMRTFGIGHKEWAQWLLLLRAVRIVARGESRCEAAASRMGVDARVLRRQLKSVVGMPWSALRLLPAEVVPKMLAFRVKFGAMAIHEVMSSDSPMRPGVYDNF